MSEIALSALVISWQCGGKGVTVDCIDPVFVLYFREKRDGGTAWSSPHRVHDVTVGVCI